MFDRRSLIALGMSLPVAGTSLRLDVSDPRLDPINNQGVAVSGISPDSTMLVGTADRDRLVFLDISSHAVISTTEPMDAVALIDELSVAWSPDGSKFAFSLMAWRQAIDSDIFVVDVASGEVTNLTPEDSNIVAGSLLDDIDPRIDTCPVWLDDDTVLFARHTDLPEDVPGCELATVSVSSGSTETFLDLAAHNILWLDSKIWQLSGGELVLGVSYRDGDKRQGAIMISPDGEVTETELGIPSGIIIESVNDTHMIVSDVREYAWWYISLDNSEEPILLWEKFSKPEGLAQRSIPILGPEPDTMFVVLKTTEDVDSAHLFENGAHEQLAQITGEGQSLTPHWASKLILVSGNPDSWLVPLDGV